ncbi:MAG: glycerol-3-phosphate 1-O-acyltransferase PlsY [Elusimicrobia bacterium]|nr:glycerol-3-phosphate 1-O-acyltransferase PlsY [Elusimicrobiota bacterium]
MDVTVWFFIVLSYISGSIPSGYFIAKMLKGIDIREHGSGNPGAGNVYRVVGRWAGLATFAIDVAKGFIPVMLAKSYYPNSVWPVIVCGSLAIFGHMWTIFLRFRGGKGVATALGVFVAMLPVPALAAFAVALIFMGVTGHISAGSMVGAIVFSAAGFLVKGTPKEYAVTSLIISAVILYKHIPNLKRLLNKKELGFKEKCTKQP